MPKDLGDIVTEFKKSFVATIALTVADPTRTDASEVGVAASAKTLATE